MIKISLSDIEETQEFVFVVKGKPRLTLSINPHNLSLQIPGGVSHKSISNNPGSFFLRTNDFDESNTVDGHRLIGL